jgi:hypothetical protein
MGFNSWTQFGRHFNATNFMETADAFVKYGLKDVGYLYVNSDDGWTGGRANATGGREGHQMPHGRVFPGSGYPGGMRAVADYVHGLGLKIGLYTARAARTCGNGCGSCMNEVVDAQTWSNWTIDYIKDDSCGSCRAPADEEPHADYAAQQRAINAVDLGLYPIVTCHLLRTTAQPLYTRFPCACSSCFAEVTIGYYPRSIGRSSSRRRGTRTSPRSGTTAAVATCSGSAPT